MARRRSFRILRRRRSGRAESFLRRNNRAILALGWCAEPRRLRGRVDAAGLLHGDPDDRAARDGPREQKRRLAARAAEDAGRRAELPRITQTSYVFPDGAGLIPRTTSAARPSGVTASEPSAPESALSLADGLPSTSSTCSWAFARDRVSSSELWRTAAQIPRPIAVHAATAAAAPSARGAHRRRSGTTTPLSRRSSCARWTIRVRRSGEGAGPVVA
jgi:hypothetical protein